MMLIVLPPKSEDLRQTMALRFCRKFMENCLGAGQIYFPEPVMTVTDLLALFPYENIFAFSSPLAIINSDSVKLLEKVLNEGSCDIAVPSLGGISGPQSPVLPFQYMDMDTFEEVTRIMQAEHSSLSKPVKHVCSEFLMTTGSLLESLDPDTSMDGMLDAVIACGSRRVLVRSALAHAFSGYYRHERADLADLIPDNAHDLLEVGCGEGGLGRILKARMPEVRVTGIEPDEQAADKACQIYEHVHHGKVESFPAGCKFDCIIMGDVLEHLYDPWLALSKLRQILKAGGSLVGSCPNAGHWTVVRSLWQGRFSYIPAGILCFDHIRFFTRRELTDMIKDAGFSQLKIWSTKAEPTPEGKRFIANMVSSGWYEEDLLTLSFNFRAIAS